MIDSTVRGANGGNARAAKLTKEQRSAIAKQAAAKRWATPKIYMEEPRFIPAVSPRPEGWDFGARVEAPASTTIELGPTTIETFHEQLPPPIIVTIPTPQPAPIPYIPPPAAPEPPKPSKSRRKPIVKEFSKAYSRAEKLLEEALKKRSDAVKVIIACNEDIPMYVNVINSLGGTVDPQAMKTVDIRSLNGNGTTPNAMPAYQMPAYQSPQSVPPRSPLEIDSALFHANSGPIPGISTPIQKPEIISGVVIGGTEEYVPRS